MRFFRKKIIVFLLFFLLILGMSKAIHSWGCNPRPKCDPRVKKFCKIFCGPHASCTGWYCWFDGCNASLCMAMYDLYCSDGSVYDYDCIVGTEGCPI